MILPLFETDLFNLVYITNNIIEENTKFSNIRFIGIIHGTHVLERGTLGISKSDIIYLFVFWSRFSPKMGNVNVVLSKTMFGKFLGNCTIG